MTNPAQPMPSLRADVPVAALSRPKIPAMSGDGAVSLSSAVPILAPSAPKVPAMAGD